MYICFAYTYTFILVLVGYAGCSDKPTDTQGSGSNQDNLPSIGGLSLVPYSDSEDEDNFQVTEPTEDYQSTQSTLTEQTNVYQPYEPTQPVTLSIPQPVPPQPTIEQYYPQQQAQAQLFTQQQEQYSGYQPTPYEQYPPQPQPIPIVVPPQNITPVQPILLPIPQPATQPIPPQPIPVAIPVQQYQPEPDPQPYQQYQPYPGPYQPYQPYPHPIPYPYPAVTQPHQPYQPPPPVQPIIPVQQYPGPQPIIPAQQYPGPHVEPHQQIPIPRPPIQPYTPTQPIQQQYGKGYPIPQQLPPGPPRFRPPQQIRLTTYGPPRFRPPQQIRLTTYGPPRFRPRQPIRLTTYGPPRFRPRQQYQQYVRIPNHKYIRPTTQTSKTTQTTEHTTEQTTESTTEPTQTTESTTEDSQPTQTTQQTTETTEQSTEDTEPTTEPTQQATEDTQQHTQHTQLTELEPETIPVEVGSDESEGEEGGEDKEPSEIIKTCNEITLMKKDDEGNLVEMIMGIDYKEIWFSKYNTKYLMLSSLEQLMCDGECVYTQRSPRTGPKIVVYNRNVHAFIFIDNFGFILFKRSNNKWTVDKARKYPDTVNIYTLDNEGNEIELNEQNYEIDVTAFGSFKYRLNKGVRCHKIVVKKLLVWKKEDVDDDYPNSFCLTTRNNVMVFTGENIEIYGKSGGKYRHLYTKKNRGYNES